jgi:hypothetical protein
MGAAGLQTSQAWFFAGRGGEFAPLAQGYIGALSARKDFLYRITERWRVAASLVEDLLRREPKPRMLLFHERVAEAAALFNDLQLRLPGVPMALEHSDLPTAARKAALERFRSGEVGILVSVKSLVEGIDVPDADVGISVASSSSVRQRIQTLGRVLRRRFDGGVKQAEMHVLYAHDTVDESIYGKQDWSDLTGADANRYWLWPLDPELAPEMQPGPPREPVAGEESEWKRLGESVPDSPVRWLGEVPDWEYSVDTRGNVTTSEGAWIDNPEGLAVMVERVRGRPGGRFRVTPILNLVLVFREVDGGMVPFLAGQLPAVLRVRDGGAASEAIDASLLKPGDEYTGPTDREGGTYKLRQKHGGVIERKVGALAQFAITDVVADEPARNGAAVLSSWKTLRTSGFTFYVNAAGHAWYREAGQARFLASVAGGFRWPEPDTSNEATNRNDATSA